MATAFYEEPSYSNPYLQALVSGFYFEGTISFFFAGSGWDSDNARNAFEGAVNAWAAVANITFQEASASNGATWNEELYEDAESSTVGRHYYPNNEGLGGEFNSAHPIFTAANNLQGAISFVTFLHEIGHGLGLDHPFEGDVFPGVTVDDPFDPGDNNFNNGFYTVMSYDDSPWFASSPSLSYGFAGTPMAFDIAAIQAIYGPNTSTATGDNVYILPIANISGTFWSTIWDAGGIDTISGAANSGGVTIDLRAATLLNEEGGGGRPSWQSGTMGGDTIYGGFAIANGVIIENAIGSNHDDILTGNAFANLLNGGNGDDMLVGDGGDDRLIGGAGLDSFAGGSGDDTYYIDRGNEVITELAADGFDTVRSTAANYTLSVGLERLFLDTGAINGFGNAVRNIINGNDGANIIEGRAGNDTIRGFDGNDVLDGGSGVDRAYGGIGDDRYFVDQSNDRIFENSGEGTDTVFAEVSYTLRDNAENLTLTGSAYSGTGNDLSNIIIGTAGNNRLAGNDGDDRLEAGDGNDLLFGGAGRDLFEGGAGSDIFVFELGDFAGSGIGDSDAILDFSQIESDRIDLRRIDAIAGGSDDRFTFIGVDEFTGESGQLRYESRGANTFVEGDIDGDGAADFTIRINGLWTLEATDFFM